MSFRETAQTLDLYFESDYTPQGEDLWQYNFIKYLFK